MRERKPRSKSGIKAERKLSEIIIEIARIGWKAPFSDEDPAPPAIHILMFMAQEAWNREVLTMGPCPNREHRNKCIESMINKLEISQSDLKLQLISMDWETIIEMMRMHKRRHFPEDRRQIISCGTTPQDTFRVIWK